MYGYLFVTRFTNTLQRSPRPGSSPTSGRPLLWSGRRGLHGGRSPGRVTGGAASDEPLRRVTTDMACVVAVDEVPLPRLEGTSSGEDLDRSPGGSSGGENPVWFAMVPTQLQVQLFSRYTKSPDHSSALWQLLRGEERVH